MSSRIARASSPSLDASALRLAIVLSNYHPALGEGLLAGARHCLEAHGLTPGSVPVIRVPGAFEVPQAVSRLIARHVPPLNAVVALGVLIRGETLHFEVLSHQVCRGLDEVARATGVPVTFGILTVDAEAQARDRAGRGTNNKGWEATLAAIEMASLFQRLETSETQPDEAPGARSRRRMGR